MFRSAIAIVSMAWLANCGSNSAATYAQDANAQSASAQDTNAQPYQAQNSNSQNSNTFAVGNMSTVSNASQVASALACPNDANDAYASARIACVQAINAYRSTLGLSAYTRWCGVAGCIDQQTQSDSQAQTAHSAFGQCSENAQNECPGWPTPMQAEMIECLGDMWNEGPGTNFSQHGHYINMTSTTYTQVECGLSLSGNVFWAAMDFR